VVPVPHVLPVHSCVFIFFNFQTFFYPQSFPCSNIAQIYLKSINDLPDLSTTCVYHVLGGVYQVYGANWYTPVYTPAPRTHVHTSCPLSAPLSTVFLWVVNKSKQLLQLQLVFLRQFTRVDNGHLHAGCATL
jgi:hypothetical protein